MSANFSTNDLCSVVSCDIIDVVRNSPAETCQQKLASRNLPAVLTFRLDHIVNSHGEAVYTSAPAVSSRRRLQWPQGRQNAGAMRNKKSIHLQLSILLMLT